MGNYDNLDILILYILILYTILTFKGRTEVKKYQTSNFKDIDPIKCKFTHRTFSLLPYDM